MPIPNLFGRGCIRSSVAIAAKYSHERVFIKNQPMLRFSSFLRHAAPGSLEMIYVSADGAPSGARPLCQA
jgi:hypothetical protein